MHVPSRILTLLLASAVVFPLASTLPVLAADNQAKAVSKDAVATVSEAANDQIIKTVDEAYQALRGIRAARLAIFNGTPDMATKYADKAVVDLEKVQSEPVPEICTGR